MEKIRVKAQKPYDITIGKGLLAQTGETARKLSGAKRAAIVTDDIVDGLYGGRVRASLEAAGFSVVTFVFPNGEESKSIAVLSQLYDFLAESAITRKDLIVALGGGVVGDLAGFAAASYLRGVDFIQIPTTLLAQVDSSVGGKTGVNIKAGKNLVGAFNQPIHVICDIETLDTLSDELFASGMAEVIKYGMIRSKSLFESVSAGNVKSRIADIIKECVEIKALVVEHDERESGERMILNFGHTLGHALENHFGYGGISHGAGVAMGMGIFTRLAEEEGLCEKGMHEKLCRCLKANGLPYDTDVSIKTLYPLTLKDKKRALSYISIILCPEIGKAQILRLSIDEYRKFLKLD